MASFNKVILIGNLVADPELKKTPSGIAVTSFRIAVSRRFSKDAEQQQADFFDIVCWRSTAEFVTKFFTKGKPILVCGSLQNRSWTDKEGQRRNTIEVVADEVSFVERKSDFTPSHGEGTYYGASAEHKSEPAAAPKFEELSTEDDLPF